MEQLKRTPIIILLCLLSFFSCKPTDIISPKNLNAQELEALVQSMPEFQQYQRVRTESTEALLLRLKNLDKKDAKWVAHMHQKYPTPEIFMANVETNELALYKELTGLELLEESPINDTYFRDFMFKLQLSASYDPHDLAQILFPSLEKKTVEKFFPTCSSYCVYEAGRQQRKTYSLCTQYTHGDPTKEAICALKAEFAFKYHLVKCIQSCTGY